MARPKHEPVRNKEITKRKIIDAVGEVLRTDGYRGLKINNIAKIGQRTGFSKKLIYVYFKSLNGLIEAYAQETDYWMTYNWVFKELIRDQNTATSEQLITTTLQNQFRFFFQTKEMQELIRWELTGESALMRSIHNVREMIGQEFMALADPHFENSNINIRGIIGIIVAGIYYSTLHQTTNGEMFCDLNLNSQEGTDAIIDSIGQIIRWAYQAAANND